MEVMKEDRFPKQILRYRPTGMKQEAVGEGEKIAFITEFPDDRRDPINLNHVDDEEVP
jgi:hypothetical protein